MPTLANPARPSVSLRRLRSRACAASIDALCFAILVTLGGCCLVGSVVVETARLLTAPGPSRASFPAPAGKSQPASWRGKRAAAFPNVAAGS